MKMGVMELAVEIYKNPELKELVENYIEQKDQEKNISAKGSGNVCDIAHETDTEESQEIILKNWMRAWLECTNNAGELSKVYIVMKNLKGAEKEEVWIKATSCDKVVREIISMLNKANIVQLKNLRAFISGYLL